MQLCCSIRAAGHSTAQAAVCGSVQNATARLITGTRRSDHISPVLRELHCGTLWNSVPVHPRARQVQSGMPGSPVAVRAGASLLGRRLASRVRQHSALSAVS